jgi:hypothetical protein
MYPADSHEISMAVSPGNLMSASVQYVTSGQYAGQFELSITDVTTSASYSRYRTPPSGYTALQNTAEWIAEAPATIESGNVTILPLSEFGTVNFSDASASLSNGVSGPISTFSSYPSFDSITLAATSSGLGATPSPLGSTGSSFTIATTMPGDVNSDGKVDINDLTIVLANYGKTAGMWWGTGDLVGDGIVDLNDLTEVLANYGKTLSASAAGVAAVPEPSSVGLLVGAVGLLGWVGIRGWGLGIRARTEAKARISSP